MIAIGERRYSILRIATATEVGAQVGVRITRPLPVYFLDGPSGRHRGAYHPNHDFIVVFTNTDLETIKHELVHAVEYHQEKRPELIRIYELALERIVDASFPSGLVSYNFRKNIHEFIADGWTKPALIEALEREGLYEAFVAASKYLFKD